MREGCTIRGGAENPAPSNLVSANGRVMEMRLKATSTDGRVRQLPQTFTASPRRLSVSRDRARSKQSCQRPRRWTRSGHHPGRRQRSVQQVIRPTLTPFTLPNGPTHARRNPCRFKPQATRRCKLASPSGQASQHQDDRQNPKQDHEQPGVRCAWCSVPMVLVTAALPAIRPTIPPEKPRASLEQVLSYLSIHPGPTFRGGAPSWAKLIMEEWACVGQLKTHRNHDRAPK
jgi:hypothetical protein